MDWHTTLLPHTKTPYVFGLSSRHLSSNILSQRGLPQYELAANKLLVMYPFDLANSRPFHKKNDLKSYFYDYYVK
jgi:hypothetical protein